MHRYILLAAIVAFTFLSTGCEDPGNVGGRFLDDSANLETKTVSIGAIEPFSANTFTGRHRYMPMGIYDDPLFGKLQTVGVIKPSIDTTNTGPLILPEDDFKLRLVFSDRVYGDSLATSSFSVYRLDDFWRGNELRFGDTLPLDESEKVGEFSVTGTETVEIDLSPNWIEEYNEYLSSEAVDRDSTYRNEFPGLAVVPDDENSKVLFARITPESGEDDNNLEFVRFVLDRPEEEINDENGNGENGNGENGNGDGNGENGNGDDNGENGNGDDEENGENGEEEDEDPRIYQRLVDWGSTMVRSEAQVPPEGLPVQSMLDQLFRISPELTEEKIGSRNIANAELVVYADQSQLNATLPAGHYRPEPTFARINIIDAGNPGDLIFGRDPNLVAEFNEDDGSFRFDITDYANSVLFDTPPEGMFYFSVESVNGINYSTLIFDDNAPEEYRPKILITSVNSDSE